MWKVGSRFEHILGMLFSFFLGGGRRNFSFGGKGDEDRRGDGERKKKNFVRDVYNKHKSQDTTANLE